MLFFLFKNDTVGTNERKLLIVKLLLKMEEFNEL